MDRSLLEDEGIDIGFEGALEVAGTLEGGEDEDLNLRVMGLRPF